jgi:hypothetical protein
MAAVYIQETIDRNLLAATPVVESNTTVSIFEGNPLKFEANYQIKCEFSKFFGGPELFKKKDNIRHLTFIFLR